MRILVTASREHAEGTLIFSVLDEVYEQWQKTATAEDEFVVVHGDARGGDQYAKAWVLAIRGVENRDLRVREEAHPAQWNHHHRAAGHIRNQEMVDLGADRCLGFPIGRSPGTRGCMRLAKKAGISVQQHDLPPAWQAQ